MTSQRIPVKRFRRPAWNQMVRAGIAPAVALGLALGGVPAVAVQKSEAAQQLDFGVKVALKGSWNEAAFRFQKAVDADASDPHAWCNLAVARESLGQIDAARAAYEKAIALAPDDERIRTNYERFQSYLKSTRGAPGAP
jgi:Tfp pilus assembly protein PilF